jgi:nitric oxide reductase subunit B
MLGLGLVLFCLRALRPGMAWKDKPLAIAFWCINIGLFAMVVISVLPIGLMQAWASVEHGTWYARSSEFLQSPLVTKIRWSRIFGDTLFAFGAMVLGGFVLGLLTGHSYDKNGVVREGELSVRNAETMEAQTTSAD